VTVGGFAAVGGLKETSNLVEPRPRISRVEGVRWSPLKMRRPSSARVSFPPAARTVTAEVRPRSSPPLRTRRRREGDVLIRNGRITAVGADLAPRAPGTRVLDAGGRLVIPGPVDTHRMSRVWRHGASGNRCRNFPWPRPGRTHRP
jgi:hypothetical protein